GYAIGIRGAQGRLVASDCVFTTGAASGASAAVSCLTGASCTLERCAVMGRTLLSDASALTLRSSTITGCSLTCVSALGGLATLSAVTIAGNTLPAYAAVRCTDCDLRLD